MEHKKCPVDRGKLLIGLEICLNGYRGCAGCPYYKSHDCAGDAMWDALGHIYWLEELVSIQEKEIKTLRGAILEIKDCATAALLTYVPE